jgi:hypothetical protein
MSGSRNSLVCSSVKRHIHSQLNWAILLCDVIPDGKKLFKPRSFDRQKRRPQNCPFQSSFTHRTAQFTQGISQFPQLTCRHHDVTRTRGHIELTKKTDKPDWKPALCQRTFSSVFRAVFQHSYTAQFNLECMGPIFTTKCQKDCVCFADMFLVT